MLKDFLLTLLKGGMNATLVILVFVAIVLILGGPILLASAHGDVFLLLYIPHFIGLLYGLGR